MIECCTPGYVTITAICVRAQTASVVYVSEHDILPFETEAIQMPKYAN